MFSYCAFYEQIIITMLNVFVKTFMYNLMSESNFHEEENEDFEIYTATFLISIFQHGLQQTKQDY